MKPVWGHDDLVQRLVAGLCGFSRGFGACKAMGFSDRNGELVGGMVFHNYSPENGTIEISIGSLSKRWATREIINLAAAYCYRDCGCHAVVARTTEHNSTRKVWKALGATEHVLPHLRGPGIPEYIYILPEQAFRDSKFAR